MKKKTIPRELERKSTKKLVERAGVAIKNDFFLEAAWALSVIFERRIKRVIRKLEGKQKAGSYTFEQAIKRLKFLHLSMNHPDFNDHFPLELIDKIRQWKNQRNGILKDMLDVHVSQARIERLANDGIQLFKDWNKSARSFKRSRQQNDNREAGSEATPAS